ncbi:DUF6796 family protein [Daejeonella sp.]|uniref:DUF6796 family protein n=1 Tax=Daejeonella sp. TaxID=2805397 RepID=UPI0030C45473
MPNQIEPIIETGFIKTAGICLLIGALLATLAMTLHPNGGDIEYIVKIKSVLTFSHSVAIFCLPLIGFGFWGLSKILETKSKISTPAFFIFSFGLLAAMIAATINGLTLPNFASNFSANDNEISTIKKIIDYGKFINIPMAIIFIVATSLSVGLWAFLITQTSKLPKWIGYFGLSSGSADGILLGFLLLSCTLVFQSDPVPGLDQQ